MHKITSNLWIGDILDLEDLNLDRITHVEFDRVVSLSETALSPTTDHHYFPDGPHDYHDFAAATDTVVDAVQADETVFVHCSAGISRSASVCAAALSVLNAYPAQSGLRRVRNARPIVNPAPEVWESAEQYVTTHFTAEAP